MSPTRQNRLLSNLTFALCNLHFTIAVLSETDSPQAKRLSCPWGNRLRRFREDKMFFYQENKFLF